MTVYLTATDAGGSGVASTQYCTDTTNVCTPSTVGTSVSVGCPAGTACQTYIRFRSTDLAGNVEAIQSAIVRIDSAPPAAVTNLTANAATQTTVPLTWSTPSDSGSGNASFDLRYRIGTTFSDSDWPAGTQVTGVPIPPVTGITVSGLVCGTTYTFAIRTLDRVGNISPLSNTATQTTVACSNTPPSRPVNNNPTNRATGVALSPTLHASTFSDLDPGDTQAASQWQIFNSRGTLIWDSGEDLSNTTNRMVPTSAGLRYNTTYRWQVRYRDNRGAWSSYSAQTSFSTQRRNRW
ncbi:MAG TPA: fibronectin type III domain-containing protein [Candidatus Methylomirabilis sp.]|nr:fibronectin type III domain-containing protein [Candidatus Methylomirabilis sp.]